MSARPPFPLPDPAANPPQQPEDTAPGATPPIKLTEDEIILLLEFFAILDEWDKKKKIA